MGIIDPTACLVQLTEIMFVQEEWGDKMILSLVDNKVSIQKKTVSFKENTLIWQLQGKRRSSDGKDWKVTHM